jgi:transcriptional regulator with XRE-family HTH domain
MDTRYSQKDQAFLKKLGQAIKEARQEKGLSQEGLALTAGIDRSYIGGVERGERNISALNLKKISDALKLSLSELVKTVG